MRAIVVITIASLIPGCMYMRGNLEEKKGKYKNYPTSASAEQKRRTTRRRNALIASPIEIVGGAGITALALFAKSSPMDDGDDSVVDNLGDAGKEIAGRLVMASIGGAAVLGGIADLVLGATDPLYASPLVRNGELVAADRIDVIEPPHSPRLTLHLANLLGTRAVGSELGFGIAHWVSDHVRLRYGAAGNYMVSYWSETRGGFTVETNAQYAFSRERGQYPHSAIGVYGGGGWTWTSTRDAPVATGGISFDVGIGQYRLGTRYTPGVERYPSIELNLQLEVGGD